MVAHVCSEHVDDLPIILFLREVIKHRVEADDFRLNPSLEVKTVQPEQTIFHLALVLTSR